MKGETKLLACPFCGSANIDATGWASTDRSGPACDDCGGTADTVELWNRRPAPAQGESSDLIETDPTDPSRQYIPLPGGWELQTKGRGSTTRLLDRKNGERRAIQLNDGQIERDWLTKAALEMNAALSAARAEIERLTKERDEAKPELEKLVTFFRQEGYARFGFDGDARGWSPVTTAIEAMKNLMRAEATFDALRADRDRMEAALREIDAMIFRDPQIIERASEMRAIIVAALNAEQRDGGEG